MIDMIQVNEIPFVRYYPCALSTPLSLLSSSIVLKMTYRQGEVLQKAHKRQHLFALRSNDMD